MLRMSLRTSSPSQARRRAQALELVRNAMMEQLPILRRQIRPDDLPALFKRAFERELDRTTLAQISDPCRIDEHRNFNRHYARYFSLLAEKPYLLAGSLESFEDLRAMGLSETRCRFQPTAHKRTRHADRRARSAACINPDSQQIFGFGAPCLLDASIRKCAPGNEKSPGFPGLFKTVLAAT